MQFSIVMFVTALVAVAQCRELDPLARIDRLLELSFRNRNLRDLDYLKEQRNDFIPHNYAEKMQNNGTETDEVTDGWINRSQTFSLKDKIPNNNHTSAQGTQNDRLSNFSPGQNQESDDDYGDNGTVRQAQLVPISQTVPVVVQKYMPLPLILPHPLPLSILPVQTFRATRNQNCKREE